MPYNPPAPAVYCRPPGHEAVNALAASWQSRLPGLLVSRRGGGGVREGGRKGGRGSVESRRKLFSGAPECGEGGSAGTAASQKVDYF